MGLLKMQAPLVIMAGQFHHFIQVSLATTGVCVFGADFGRRFFYFGK